VTFTNIKHGQIEANEAKYSCSKWIY